jgi:hypothetical protein
MASTMTPTHPVTTDSSELLGRLETLLQRRVAREIDDLGYRVEFHSLLQTFRSQTVAA